jgi:5-methylcytosine-specific restriction endonuclease McrA
MKRCHDCQNYLNLSTKKTGGGIRFERNEFIAWKRASPDRRRCTYCGIDSTMLYALNIQNPRNKSRYEAIGVDRIDNGRPYDLYNLVPCCPLCNQIKSQLLTYAEMAKLGSHVRALWDGRLAMT